MCNNRCNFCGTLNSGSCGCGAGQQILINKNTTEVIPVSGMSAYETYMAYNPTSTWTEAEFLENYVQGQLVYENFEI